MIAGWHAIGCRASMRRRGRLAKSGLAEAG